MRVLHVIARLNVGGTARYITRLAEELPRHVCVTESDRLLRKAAQVIINRRDQTLESHIQENLLNWLDQWENWAYRTYNQVNKNKTEKYGECTGAFKRIIVKI